ncbi:hypothetical protein AN2V17_13270 [Vallitalea sp. AN17-2]|uniref:Uncharacterized protein n=1 Tax=Vallitalea maricola TaxID=3074433 RepID=A0ACB5UGM6_9FIRM|nr:hypothetical protein AN2V17_13270 [Vallitalea sp. AN17-2]
MENLTSQVIIMYHSCMHVYSMDGLIVFSDYILPDKGTVQYFFLQENKSVYKTLYQLYVKVELLINP